MGPSRLAFYNTAASDSIQACPSTSHDPVARSPGEAKASRRPPPPCPRCRAPPSVLLAPWQKRGEVVRRRSNGILDAVSRSRLIVESVGALLPRLAYLRAKKRGEFPVCPSLIRTRETQTTHTHTSTLLRRFAPHLI